MNAPTRLHFDIDHILNVILPKVLARRRLVNHKMPRQIDYAHSVWEDLSTPGDDGKTRIGLAQADTGTGKTLGYLIPLMLHSVQRNRRVAVSTYTLQLMHQLVDQDNAEADIAAECVEELTAQRPTYAKRMGRNNYLSVPRITQLFSEHPAYKEAMPWLLEIAQNENDGLLASWLELGYEMPKRVNESMITLQSGDEPKDHSAAFVKHLEASKGADVVITTHAMMLLNARYGFQVLDDERPIAAAIFDEADRLPDAAASLFSKKTSIQRIQHKTNQLAKETDEHFTKNADKAIKAAMEWFREILDRHGPKESLPVAALSGEDRAQCLGHVKQLRKALDELDGVAQDADKNRRVKDKDRIFAEFFTECVVSLREFQNAMTGKSGETFASDLVTPSLSWSPEEHYPGFRLTPVYPGRVVGYYWMRKRELNEEGKHTGNYRLPHLEAAILTSATLTTRPDTGYQDTKTLLGINSSNDWHIHPPLSPSRHGTVTFVLSDPTAPSPSRPRELTKADIAERKAHARRMGLDEEAIMDLEESVPGAHTNPVWIQYATEMVREAMRRGKTLVLAQSYSDAEEIAKGLGPSVLLHQRGVKLSKVAKQFQERSDDYRALITPAGWEGLNFRDNLVENLVLTRLPYAPIDQGRKLILDEHYKKLAKAGKIDKDSNPFWSEYHGAALRRWRQGFGRGIRSVNDQVTVWIADGRFPLPERLLKVLDRAKFAIAAEPASHRSAFKRILPSRFVAGRHCAYENALAFVHADGSYTLVDSEGKFS